MTLKVRVPVQILLKRIPLGLGSLDPFERDRAGGAAPSPVSLRDGLATIMVVEVNVVGFLPPVVAARRLQRQPLRLAFFVPVAFFRVLFSPCVRTLCVDFVDTRS